VVGLYTGGGGLYSGGLIVGGLRYYRFIGLAGDEFACIYVNSRIRSIRKR
jgi:hypothetical protein